MEAARECGVRLSVSDARKVLESVQHSPVAARHRPTLRAQQMPRLTLAEGRQMVAELKRRQVRVAVSVPAVILIGMAAVAMTMLFSGGTGRVIWEKRIKPAVDKALEQGREMLEPAR